MKARFEEAKLRDLAVGKQQQKMPAPNLPMPKQPAMIANVSEIARIWCWVDQMLPFNAISVAPMDITRTSAQPGTTVDQQKSLGRNEGKMARAVSLI